jgi:hypothetical protein
LCGYFSAIQNAKCKMQAENCLQQLRV